MGGVLFVLVGWFPACEGVYEEMKRSREDGYMASNMKWQNSSRGDP